MHTYLFSCYGSNFTNFDHLKSVYDQLKPLGAGIEMTIFSRVSRHPEHEQNLRRLHPVFSDVPITFHGAYYEVEAASPEDSEENRYLLESYLQSFDLYHLYNATSMVMHTNQRKVDEANRKQLQEYSIKTINKVSNMAVANGVNLLVENVGETIFGNQLFNFDEFISFFDRVPETTGCLIDTGHAMINGWDIEKMVEILGTRIKGYHIHNNNGKADQHLPVFTEGLLYDRKRMVHLLRTIDMVTPDADIVLEYAPTPEITGEKIRDDILAIRKCLE
jgi:sugar phosphate isomerase/epimerase